jgi:glycosyltransferase involved in cell wall biosynthesis
MKESRSVAIVSSSNITPKLKMRPEAGFGHSAQVNKNPLSGRRVGMVVFSSYPADPRPRRAAEALLHEGMRVEVICQREADAPKRESVADVNVTRVPVIHHRGGRLSYAYEYGAFILLAAAILGWRSLNRRYDLIYVHNMPDILVFCALIPKLFGAKVILDQHDPMPELMETIFGLDEESRSVRVIRLLEKLSLSFADLVITVNIACKRLFAARSCKAEKIGVVMNAPDGRIFSYRPAEAPLRSVAPSKPFVIMYHGSLVERNGVGLAVDSMARVIESIPNAELRIYGRKTEYLESVMRKATEQGLDSCVKYLGSRTLEQLVQEIAGCDIGVIPNQRNPFTDINTPTRIFEFLALGKPVVAPRTRGIEDYFYSQAISFFEAGDADDLAARLEHCYRNAEQTGEVTRRGQHIYLQHNWEKERQELVNLVSGLFSTAQQRVSVEECMAPNAR